MVARKFTWLGVLIVLSTLVGLAACRGDGTGIRLGEPLELAIVPGYLILNVGETGQLSAVSFAEEDAPLDVAPSMMWRSSEPLTATVSQAGEVTGLAPGVAFITAECGESCAIARVRVLGSDDDVPYDDAWIR